MIFSSFSGAWLCHWYCQEIIIHEYCQEKDKHRLNLMSPYSSDFESDPQISKLSAVCRKRAGVDTEKFDKLTLFERYLIIDKSWREVTNVVCTDPNNYGLKRYTGSVTNLLGIIFSELLDPVSNGSLSSGSGAIIGMPHYMARDSSGAELNFSNLVIKTNYNRWFKGFRIPENIRLNIKARFCISSDRILLVQQMHKS